MAVGIEYLRIQEVATRFGTSVDFIEKLAQIDIIHLELDPGGESRLSPADAERVRLGVILTEELEVNLAGVEVILHMREDNLAIQRQFAELLAGIAHELKKGVR